MTWHLNKIPKIVHFYWGNEKLSFLRYMTVVSFMKLNPDWKVKIHAPTVVGSLNPTWGSAEQKNVNIVTDYSDSMKKLPIEFVYHDFSKFGFNNNAHEVHKSDFIRWHILATDGGLWSDMDIVYTKPMDSINENLLANSTTTVALVPYKDGGHTVGFLLSSGGGNSFYSYIFDLAKKRYNPQAYEGIGCMLINSLGGQFKIFPKERVIYLDQRCVYSIMWYSTELFFNPDITPPAPNESIGYHWYAGHPNSQQWDTRITESNYKTFNSIISKSIEAILQ